MSGDKVPNQFKQSALTTAMWLGAFILVSLVSLIAVRSSNEGRSEASRRAERAVIIADQLQSQLNCTVKILTQGVTGVVDNAIEQNNLLLASVEATDRNAVADNLKASRTRLTEISAAATAAEQDCTK